MSRRTACVVVAMMAVVGLGACGDDESPSTAPATVPSTTSVAASREVSFGNVTLRIPGLWDDSVGDTSGIHGAFGPTIHVKKGYALGRLNVVTFSGTIDDLGPRNCAGSGDRPAVTPSAVRLDDTGTAPLGDRVANFAQWTATCPGGPEVHRAWVLPTSRLLFWETCADPAIGAILTTVTVADTLVAYQDVTPLPNEFVPNCDDSDKTDTTTG